MTIEDRERIARLEAYHEQMLDSMNKLVEKTDRIEGAVTKWHGVVFGITVTVSAFWGAIAGIWTFVKHKIGG